LGDLNENTLTAIMDTSRPVRTSVTCVSYLREGVPVTVILIKYDLVV